MGFSDDFVSIAQAATAKGVTKTAILYAIRDGRIPGAIRYHRTWVIPRASLEGYVPRGGHGRPSRVSSSG